SELLSSSFTDFAKAKIVSFWMVKFHVVLSGGEKSTFGSFPEACRIPIVGLTISTSIPSRPTRAVSVEMISSLSDPGQGACICHFVELQDVSPRESRRRSRRENDFMVVGLQSDSIRCGISSVSTNAQRTLKFRDFHNDNDNQSPLF